MFFFLNNSKVFQNLKWFIRLKILARLAFYKKSNHSKKNIVLSLFLGYLVKQRLNYLKLILFDTFLKFFLVKYAALQNQILTQNINPNLYLNACVHRPLTKV